MKIRQHPRMRGICIGDDVYCYPQQLFARVEEVFPAAVCVKVGILSIRRQMELLLSPQLWRADDIENLSVCRYCGTRDGLCFEAGTGIPFRVCKYCLGEEPRPEVPPDSCMEAGVVGLGGTCPCASDACPATDGLPPERSQPQPDASDPHDALIKPEPKPPETRPDTPA
ncbi:MAG TPA: hypothetical protein VFS21_31335 [Roseiflexaceae bacterium]|nr:hypothetical protein [Roseiflexaceae bacterium]